MTTNEIKALLKSNGINTKLVRVNQERSFIYITLLSYSISRTVVENILSSLHTVKNISHDWDPIYIGQNVCVKYKAEVTEEIKSYIKNRCENHECFSVHSHTEVDRMAGWMDLEKAFPSLRRYDYADLICRVMG